tara:strand:+ start:9400 stop:9732 length:333 start_codon:yes stop_codon:yes gene_type:complete
MSEIIITSSESPYALSTTTAEVLEDGRVIVTESFAPHNWQEGHNYRERRRYFKSRANAARKLRAEMADVLASEMEGGEMVEAGDASWRGEPYPIDSAIRKLEDPQIRSVL